MTMHRLFCIVLLGGAAVLCACNPAASRASKLATVEYVDALRIAEAEMRKSGGGEWEARHAYWDSQQAVWIVVLRGSASADGEFVEVEALCSVSRGGAVSRLLSR